LKATRTRFVRVLPVNTDSRVSKLLPEVEILTAPAAGAVHVHQTDLPPIKDGFGSPTSRVAEMLLPVVVMFVPKSMSRVAK
jgi:hypothetical protein